jgi:predicted metal-dependent hydrolase
MAADQRLHPVPETAQRLAPEVTLPPYSYVTGKFPHPFSDPAGHSFGRPPDKPAAVDPACWRDSREFCHGVDLFNQGFYWEAHEVWEGLWHAAGRRGPLADLFKGLIKLAAAGVKAREGRLAGLQRHARRAGDLFAAARSHSGGRLMGLDIDELMAAAEQLARQQAVAPDTGAAVQRVLDVVLRPQ